MNELGAIGVCRAYVAAQREYASQDRDNDEVLSYAQRLRSTSGKHDGLYWHAEPGGELSPFGPLIAEAKEAGYRHETKIMTDEQLPYRGYYFKILTRQGKSAPGGELDYMSGGNLTGGFALVAYPERWDHSGIMTFIVNQDGKIYQRNLGEKTCRIAGEMKEYNPDSEWTPVQDKGVWIAEFEK